MKSPTRLFPIALALLALSTLIPQLSTAFAQNTTFTYQGLVTDNGATFTGTGQFEFALVTSLNANQTATGTANAPSGGYITGYAVVAGGSGYVTMPTVTVTGGGGSGATATAHLTGNVPTGNWGNYAGAVSNNSVTNAPANVTVFFRLKQ